MRNPFREDKKLILDFLIKQNWFTAFLESEGWGQRASIFLNLSHRPIFLLFEGAGNESTNGVIVEELSAESEEFTGSTYPTYPSYTRGMITDFSHWEREERRDRARNPQVSEREERLQRSSLRISLSQLSGLFTDSEMLDRLDGLSLKK